ncbi:hypothetical protein [Desulfopila sp. IMCC35008]|uniref:hypothetical protein n=1 Tax=Desulfopila sp. IMCC35008 TaxID=2653858 RepID=UPI002714F07B|nr:hypothetical protein [Desulfopila sp. IMCC35008]
MFRQIIVTHFHLILSSRILLPIDPVRMAETNAYCQPLRQKQCHCNGFPDIVPSDDTGNTGPICQIRRVKRITTAKNREQILNVSGTILQWFECARTAAGNDNASPS